MGWHNTWLRCQVLNQYRNARRELDAERGQGGAEQERLLLALQWLTALRGELASGLVSGASPTSPALARVLMRMQGAHRGCGETD